MTSLREFGDFSFITKKYIKDMVQELFGVIEGLEQNKKQEIVAFVTRGPNPGRGFFTTEVPYQNELMEKCKTGHSGASWAIVLRHMELLYKDWNEYVSTMLTRQVKDEELRRLWRIENELRRQTQAQLVPKYL